MKQTDKLKTKTKKTSQLSSSLPTRGIKKENNDSLTEEEKAIIQTGKKENDGRRIVLPLEFIHTADNHRSKIKNIPALAAAIAKEGLIHPIQVQILNDKFTVVSGHRRLAAYKYLASKDSDFNKITCQYKHITTHSVRNIYQTSENLNQEPLSTLDEAIAIKEMKLALGDNGEQMSNEKIGERLGGKDRRTIDIAIKIASWPDNIHELIRKYEEEIKRSFLYSIGKVSLTHNEIEKKIIDHINLNKNKDRIHKPLGNSLSSDRSKEFIHFLSSKIDDVSLLKELKKCKSWLGSEKARNAIIEFSKSL